MSHPLINKCSLLMFLSILFIYSCKVDSDCWTKSRPDIHSLYCIDNQCSRLLPAGRHCTYPSECASYFFYGPLACSSPCKAENSCAFDDGKITPFCCRAVPEGKECVPGRPNLLNGCDARQLCLMGNEGEYRCVNKNSHLWLLGVFLSISGNLNINLGLNLQKKAFRQSSLSFFSLQLSTFHVGIFLYILGKTLGFASYTFGNQSLLTSLGAFGLIANSIFAPMINSELFTWRDLVAIILVLSGSTVILTNAGKAPRAFSLCELLKMYQRKETIIWFSFLGASVVLLFFTIKFIEINSDWRLPGDNFNFLSCSFYFDETNPFLRYGMLLFYVGLSAIIGSLSSLFAKSFGEMIDQTINGDNQFMTGMPYVFLILIILCTAVQVYWLSRALRHYDALLVVPVFHVIWTILSVVTGGIYFQDFEHFTMREFRGFIGGLMIIFCGSAFLATRILTRNVVVVREVVLEQFVVDKSEEDD